MPPLAQRAAAILELRRRRDAQLGNLFGEPAWDILLGLYVAAWKGRKIAASAVGLEAAIAPTTALRCLATLERYDLVKREPDCGDQRRVWILLSPRGIDRIERLLKLVTIETIEPPSTAHRAPYLEWIYAERQQQIDG